ncbi:MAG TPA: YSC84-related protein [Trinickia sp.]|jgi:lipid-binding SYLF domain-containing protein|uniref:BPSL1445 family SYLF domain-containing lipoprotein n=1 Tax=Trinickia sp. TaxID=2571163 RepID=UPI002C8DDAB6|nr:YSC84-related protein [Trinickia sp.]HTI16388.1 YSC84-related protein [Trinickia sp.]
MKRRTFIASCTFATTAYLTGCTITRSSPQTPEQAQSKRREIDAGVDGTLSQLFSTIPGSRELASKANGILVFPKIIAAGFIIGGEYGEGALRIGGVSQSYYRTTSGSFGFLAGAQSKSLILMFMNQDALNKFRQSKGWTAGVDGSVAFAKVGANGQLDTNTAQAPIIAFALTNAGLMANLSLEGTKIGKLDI